MSSFSWPLTQRRKSFSFSFTLHPSKSFLLEAISFLERGRVPKAGHSHQRKPAKDVEYVVVPDMMPLDQDSNSEQIQKGQ